MKKILIYLISNIITIFLIVTNAYAYLDPGTGGIIIQAILGVIAAAVAYCSFYINKIKFYFKKLFSKKKSKED